jgi:dTDP-4-dehydrorhamnose 3,5-epimerase
MKLLGTKLAGVFIIELSPHADERGFYKRLWGKDELEKSGLDSELNNVGLSFNKKCGTVRGMHYQAEPFAETKLVQCMKGKIFDVVLDLRKDSETFGEWIGEELSAENNRAFYIPKGLAHGFQTLADNSEVLYAISTKYDLNSSRGVRWNDEKFRITFPLEISIINERDANYPDFEV